ncbi:MAG TPA: Hsp20/alpha crystallin family protein [Gemmataceae bacterium]|nr:Hsp20/alpha crystallin family protein [Gemmataceae bacterium]
MTQVRFGDLWSEMGRVNEELNRLFGRFNGSARTFPPQGPAINVWEDEQNVYAEADLPGMDMKKLEVLVVEGNVLTIQGERSVEPPEGAVWHRQERGFGQFMRQITLPAMIDADKVEAKYENGVLLLTLPKSEAAKPKKINVVSA